MKGELEPRCNSDDHNALWEEYFIESDESMRDIIERTTEAAVQRMGQLQASRTECESYKARAEAAEKDRRAWYEIAQSRLEAGLVFDASQQKLIDELKKLCIELRVIVHNSTQLDLDPFPRSRWWTRLAAADDEMDRLGLEFNTELPEADNDS